MKTSIIVPQVLVRIGPRRDPKVPDWAVGWFLSFNPMEARRVDLGRIGRFHDELGNGLVRGVDLFEQLINSGMIETCLGIEEGEAIAAYRYCHSVTRGKRIFLFKSVVRCRFTMGGEDNILFVPFVQTVRDQQPVIYWWWLEYQVDLSRDMGVNEDAEIT